MLSRRTVSLLASRVASRARQAGPLTDPSKLRHQAVFLMGAGGSGKGYVAHRWLKYMPGAPPEGATRPEVAERSHHPLSDPERSLSNLDFTRAVKSLQGRGFRVELADDAAHARIPVRLYAYDANGREAEIPRATWADALPPDIYRQVAHLESVVFATPAHEVPSYWRQVNPDIYKEELPGYDPVQPGYVHEMSSEMSKAYFEAALETGDPIFVDGTGANAAKMAQQMDAARAAGYRIALVFVWVPLAVNQIRNATRPRKVDPDIVTNMWHRIEQNYGVLKPRADKARKVDNRNDPHDRRTYEARAAEVNGFIARHTTYADLYSLVKDQAPHELELYPWIQPYRFE